MRLRLLILSICLCCSEKMRREIIETLSRPGDAGINYFEKTLTSDTGNLVYKDTLIDINSIAFPMLFTEFRLLHFIDIE